MRRAPLLTRMRTHRSTDYAALGLLIEAMDEIRSLRRSLKLARGSRPPRRPRR